jgi:DNA-binding transcriptional LysR family regulator
MLWYRSALLQNARAFGLQQDAVVLDWNDLRYFLAVAEQGSTLAAGRALRVSQTTVARRIAALEEAIGLPLFEKRQAGYALTSTGEALLGKAADVRSAGVAFEEAAAATHRGLGGTVRLTVGDIFANTLLPDWLVELHDRHPDIRIELDESATPRDLGAGEADIALRSCGASPAPVGTVGRRLCPDSWTFYCSREYAEQHGVPRDREQLRGHALVGGGGEMTWQAYLAVLHEIGIEEQVAIKRASMMGLLTGIRSGLGIGVLPCIIADGEPDLVRCMPPRRKSDRWLWLLTHERVRHSPAVRTVIDFLYDRLAARVRQLELA